MDTPLSTLVDTGPLAATLLADAVLEQTWAATAPETWFAAPLVIVLTCALALSKSSAREQGTDLAAFERLTRLMRARLGARATIRAALADLRRLAGAREVVMALDSRLAPALLVADAAGPGADDTMEVRTLAAEERATYFFWAPTGTAGPASRCSVTFAPPSTTVPVEFRKTHEFDSLVSVAFRVGEWNGRLFLLDAMLDNDATAVLGRFECLLRNLLPALARLCDLHARRHRAAECERARIGRELHDVVVQELADLDMELELIRMGAEPHVSVRERISRIQDRLRAQLRNIRILLQQARTHDIDASRLPAVLEDIVARFGRDTHVEADYVSETSDVRLPPEVCGEIARIVQEALVNVRRHSGARHVMVKFSCDGADWKLSIEDDGRGFGTKSWARRPGAETRFVRPPSVIHERVHSIGGTVRVVAADPFGARLEIAARRHPWKPTA